MKTYNHLGEATYETYDGWRRACKRAKPDVKFEGNKDICNAIGIGEWDGVTGSVFNKAIVTTTPSNMVVSTRKVDSTGRASAQAYKGNVPMMHAWNTGRHYGEFNGIEGQVIAAAYIPEQRVIVFWDVVRGIDGWFNWAGTDAGTSTNELEEVVMFNYDRGNYTNAYQMRPLLDQLLALAKALAKTFATVGKS